MAAEALTELAEGAEATIGALEAEVQVPASQWASEASKRRPLQPISGNGVSKDIRKTKTTEGRKPTERQLNALISLRAREESEAAMAKSDAARVELGEKVYEYVLALEERLNNKWEEKLCDAITAMEEKNRLTESKINSLEAENRELYQIVNELKTSRTGGGKVAPRAELRAPINTPLSSSPSISPATPSWPKLVQMNKGVEKAPVVPKAPVSYVQVATTIGTDLDSSQWSVVQRKRTTEKKEPTRKEIISRFMFTRQAGAERMPEADLMLELNTGIRSLEGVPRSVKAIKVLYFKKGAISVFLSKRSNTKKLITKHRDRLIKAIRTVNIIVIGVKIITKWHKVKLAEMSLNKYLHKKDIKLLKREINSQIETPLMLTP